MYEAINSYGFTYWKETRWIIQKKYMCKVKLWGNPGRNCFLQFPPKIFLHEEKFACFACTRPLETLCNGTWQQSSQLSELLCCKLRLYFNFYKKAKIDFSVGFGYNSSLHSVHTSRIAIAQTWRQVHYLPHHSAPTSHKVLRWSPPKLPHSPQGHWAPCCSEHCSLFETWLWMFYPYNSSIRKIRYIWSKKRSVSAMSVLEIRNAQLIPACATLVTANTSIGVNGIGDS